jgi:tetratricopeptide (TPR) repeat protein
MPNIAQALNMRAIIYSSQAKHYLAIDDLTLAIEHNPEYSISYNRRALIYKALGKSQEAITDLKIYIELESNDELRQEAEKLLRTWEG